MAIFAVLNEKNVVINKIVADNLEDAKAFTKAECIEHDDSSHIGSTWNGTIFIAPQPFPDWTLDANNVWQAPVPMPTDGQQYSWDEQAKSWVVVVQRGSATEETNITN